MEAVLPEVTGFFEEELVDFIEFCVTEVLDLLFDSVTGGFLGKLGGNFELLSEETFLRIGDNGLGLPGTLSNDFLSLELE